MSSLVRQKRIFLIFFSMWLALFTCFSVMVHMNLFVKLDTAVAEFVQTLRTPDLTAIAKFISNSGSTVVYIVVISVIFLLTYVVFNKRKEAIIFFIGSASAFVIYKILKLLFGRERPLEIGRLMEVTDFSYPSGHSVMTMVAYGYFAYIIWNLEDLPKTLRQLLSVCFMLYICLMGLSRIYVGVHFTTDVIGGFLLGAIILTVCIRLTNKHRPTFY